MKKGKKVAAPAAKANVLTPREERLEMIRQADKRAQVRLATGNFAGLPL
jgi:hypothetical protein